MEQKGATGLTFSTVTAKATATHNDLLLAGSNETLRRIHELYEVKATSITQGRKVLAPDTFACWVSPSFGA
jgi:catalase (peroxidase I)